MLTLFLQTNASIGEVVVTGNERSLRSPVHSVQMGALEINQATIRATPTLLGESDIIRTLQLMPGVSMGTEGVSGLYVRGGNVDENLFLIDGNPVYQLIKHSCKKRTDGRLSLSRHSPGRYGIIALLDIRKHLRKQRGRIL